MRFSYGRVAFFFIFGVCKIRIVLEPFWRGLGDGFRSFLGDFGWILGVLKRRPNSNPKLEAEKMVPRPRRGTGGELAPGSVGPNNDR